MTRARRQTRIPSSNITVREATAADRESICAVHTAAFGRSDEADLVERLIDAGDAMLSLVAVDDDLVVGHVLFSALALTMDDGRALQTAALAPVAVVPQRQRSGIGTALVREGLGRLRARGIAAAIVLGHSDYYPRFGFSAEFARKLRGPFSGPAWMAAELQPHALANVSGAVRYPDAFGLGEER
jgi:putative acetyltransferase